MQKAYEQAIEDMLIRTMCDVTGQLCTLNHLVDTNPKRRDLAKAVARIHKAQRALKDALLNARHIPSL